MLHACLLALAAVQNPSPPIVPLVTRTYDLAPASPIEYVESPSNVLLPILIDTALVGVSTQGPQATRSLDAAIDTLRRWNEAQLEYEGRTFDVFGEGRLLVRATAAEQESIGRQLSFLESTLGRRTRLLVDVTTFGPNPGVEGLPASIPAADVERWVGLALRHERHEVELGAGEVVRASNARLVSLMTSYNVEIAARSAAYDPVVERIRVGATLDMAVAPARGGLWLAANLRDGRLIGGIEPRELSLTPTIAHDGGVTTLPGPQVRDDVRLANYSMSINSFVPDGKAIVLQSSVGLETHVIFVQQVGGTTPVMHRMPEDVKRGTSAGEFALMRRDAIAPPSADVNTVGDESFPSASSLSSLYSLDQSSYVTSTIGFGESHEDLIASAVEGVDVQAQSSWLFLFAKKADALEGALAMAGQLQREPRSLFARVVLKRGTRDATVLARAALPVRVGATSTLTIGKEQMLVSDVNVEVAEAVSTPWANVARALDGFVLQLTPRDTAAGGRSIDVVGRARWSRDVPRTFDGGQGRVTQMQLQDSDLLEDARTGTIAKGDKGPLRLRLGNQGTADDALTLEVELVEGD